MEILKELSGMLERIHQPGFCVEEGQITTLNSAARGLFLTAGTDIRQLLLTGSEEYDTFSCGCLYLTMNILGQPRGAMVTREGNTEIFLLDPDCSSGELRSLALAAQEFRKPLSNVMATMDSLTALPQSQETAEQLAMMNRGLYQLLRLVGNMSDAGRTVSHQEIRNISALMDEIISKISALAGQAGLTLHYKGPEETLYCLVDADQLERAVLNLLSNAIKFTPAGGAIDASLVRQGRVLRLSIRDSGNGIADDILVSAFTRYLRQPAIEDCRCGLGLGMVLVRSAAIAHGGAVLIDRPQGGGTRITLTLAIRQNTDSMLRSPILQVDYAGERDHTLVELSDCLPSHLYEAL